MTDSEFEAFKAGFEASAEGFNGEFTPRGCNLEAWLENRFEEWKADNE